jgi:adenine-specific DNA-methyltransferase
VVKYLGSKRTLVPAIRAAVEALGVRTACDLFAGTTRVGQALRRAGVVVHSNDLATYSEALGHAYIAAGEDVDRARIRSLLAHLGELPGRRGYFTETFCERARFFQPHNGMRVDAIRDEIDRLGLEPVERGLLLTSLLEAADRVDSTCGLQMAYVKEWAPRSFNALELREPAVVPGPAGTVTRADALALDAAGAECAYLDPPYNQHSYFANYHVWETIVRGDRPEAYGVARKRVDCRAVRSAFNSSRAAWDALEALVGARIGIHNPAGERVGRVSHVRATEWLMVCGPDRGAVSRAFDGATPRPPRRRAAAAAARAGSGRPARSAPRCRPGS